MWALPLTTLSALCASEHAEHRQRPHPRSDANHNPVIITTSNQASDILITSDILNTTKGPRCATTPTPRADGASFYPACTQPDRDQWPGQEKPQVSYSVHKEAKASRQRTQRITRAQGQQEEQTKSAIKRRARQRHGAQANLQIYTSRHYGDLQQTNQPNTNYKRALSGPCKRALSPERPPASPHSRRMHPLQRTLTYRTATTRQYVPESTAEHTYMRTLQAGPLDRAPTRVAARHIRTRSTAEHAGSAALAT